MVCETEWPAPQFEQQASPDGYRVRAVVSSASEDRTCSAWHLVVTLKAAEQAAAEAVLEEILRSRPADGRNEVVSGTTVPEAGTPAPEESERNAAMVLNELKQAGLLQASGYDVVPEGGPSHQPVFATVAWASTPDGQTWRTDPVRASSKKSAQRSAAASLLDILVAHGITGR